MSAHDRPGAVPGCVCLTVHTQLPLQGPRPGSVSPPSSLLTMMMIIFFFLDLDFQGKSLKRLSYNEPSPPRCK